MPTNNYETMQTDHFDEPLPGVAEARNIVDGIPTQPTEGIAAYTTEQPIPTASNPSTEQLQNMYTWLDNTVHNLHAATAANKTVDRHSRVRGYPASVVTAYEQQLAGVAEKLGEQRARELGATATHTPQS